MNRIEFYSNLNKYKDIQEKSDNELKHYGTIGQKWGQRHYQNPDGTYTTEGKIRYFGSKKALAESQKVGTQMRDYKTGKEVNEMIDIKPNRANIKTNVETSFNIPAKYKGYEKEIAEEVSKMMTTALSNTAAKDTPKKVNVNIDDNGKIKIDFEYGDKQQKIGNLYDTSFNMMRKHNDGKGLFSETTKKFKQQLADAIKRNRDMVDAKNLTDEEIDDIVMNKMPMATSDTAISDFNTQSLRLQMEKALNTKFGSQDNQKLGSWLQDANNAIASYQAVTNKMKEDTKKEIADYYGSTEKDRQDVIDVIEKNQNVIDKMTDCLERGKMKKYMKLRNNNFDDDFEKDIAEEYAEKMYDKTKNHLAEYYVDTAFGKDQKIGSISKPRIKQKYLNPDGTLNEEGRARVDSKKNQSSVASAVFKILKYFNIAGAGVMAPVTISLAAMGAPAALVVTSLASMGVSGLKAVGDTIISKKLENRATNYYKMLNNEEVE